MNKQDLTNEVVKVTGLTKRDTMDTINAVFSVIANSMADGVEVSIPHFGKFKSYLRAERNGVNPKDTTERIVIPEKKCPKFLPASGLKEMIANA